MKSRVYKRGGKLFRYDFDECMVEYVTKVTAETKKENMEWVAEFGEPLFEIGVDGYLIADRVGLRAENWKDKEARDSYLDEWIFDMEEEAAYEMELFMKYEYPLYAKEGAV